MITTQRELRAAFWDSVAGIFPCKRGLRGRILEQDSQPNETRMAWCISAARDAMNYTYDSADATWHRYCALYDAGTVSPSLAMAVRRAMVGIAWKYLDNPKAAAEMLELSHGDLEKYRARE